MRTRRFLLVVPAAALAAAIASSSTEAVAEPSKEDVAKADALFHDAQVLVQKGRLAEGCAKFAESQAHDPANGTLLNLALCHEKEGKVATAYRELQELLAIMQTSKNPDDRERSRVATERVRQLEKKLPRVTFDMSALPKDAALTLDGEKVGDPAYPVLADPGKHTVMATADKKKPRETSFEVKDAGPMTVTLAALEDDTPPPPPPPVAPPPPKPAPPPPEPAFWSGQRVLGASLAGAGLVGVGLGTFFGLDTFSKRDERDRHCAGSVCDAEGMRLHDEAGTSATISTIAFGAGAVALAAGAYLFLATPSPKSGGGTEARLAPQIAIGPSGALLRGAF